MEFSNFARDFFTWYLGSVGHIHRKTAPYKKIAGEIGAFHVEEGPIRPFLI
jgi:hypothetical protein